MSLRTVCFSLIFSLLFILNIKAGPFALSGSWNTGIGPNASIVARHGKLLIVANSDTNNLSIFERQTGKLKATVEVGQVPLALALSADERLVYAACFYGKSLAVVDIVETSLLKLVDVGVHPYDVARCGPRILVTGYYEGKVLAVDAASLNVTDSLDLSTGLHRILVHPDGNRFYVLNTSRDALYEIDADPLRLVDSIERDLGFGGAWDMTMDASGERIYITQWNANRVVAVDTDRLAIAGFCPTGGDGACALALSGDGTLLAVNSSESDTLSIIDTDTLQCRALIPVGPFPFSDVAISPDRHWALVTSDKGGTIDVVDLKSDKLVDRVRVGNTPHFILNYQDCYYISNTGDATLAVLVSSGEKGRPRAGIFQKLYRE